MILFPFSKKQKSTPSLNICRFDKIYKLLLCILTIIWSITWRSVSSAERWWWVEQVPGTLHAIWTACTACPLSGAVRADPKWVQHLNDNKSNIYYVHPLQHINKNNKIHKSNHITILICLSSAMARARCLASQEDSSWGNEGACPPFLC